MLRRSMILLTALLMLPATWPSMPRAQQAKAAPAKPETQGGTDTFDTQQLDGHAEMEDLPG